MKLRGLLYGILLINSMLLSSCISNRPVQIDSNINSINDLASRMHREFNGGVAKAMSFVFKPKQNQFENYGLTLFNLRTRLSNMPNIVGSLENYCVHRGGERFEIEEDPYDLDLPKGLIGTYISINESEAPLLLTLIDPVPVELNGRTHCVNVLAIENLSDEISLDENPGYRERRAYFIETMAATRTTC